MSVRIFIEAVIIGIFCFSSAIATKPQKRSLNMETAIVQDGNWEVGKENTVTLKFKPLQDVPRKTKHPDEAQIYIDSGLVLVSGLPSWSGFLEKGKEYNITVVVRPSYGGKFVLGGGVDASLAKIYTDEELRKMEEEYDKKIEQIPEFKKMGMRGKFPKKTFFYHNDISTVVDVRGEIPAPDTTWQIIDGVKIRSGPSFHTEPVDSAGLAPLKVDTLKKIEQEKSKETIKPERSERSDGFFITGRFRYVNNLGIIEPVKNCQVLLYHRGIFDTTWVLDYPDVTDDTGGFILITGFPKVKLEFRSFNGAGIKAVGLIFKTDGHLDGGDPRNFHVWTVTPDSLTGDTQVPDVLTTITNPDIAGAFRLANNILTGYNYAYAVNVDSAPSLVHVYWDPVDASVITSYGGFSIWGKGGIIIQGRLVAPLGSGRDEWDREVVLHEYGHFIMDEFAERADGTFGPHVYHPPPSQPNQIDGRLAYFEGWAHFFQAAVWGVPTLEDRNNNNVLIIKIDLERPEPDVPYIDSLDFDDKEQLVPSETQPVYFAYDVEGSVTETLWDIFDLSNDDNYFIGPNLYGHNNDHTQNDSWRGITAIWNVFRNYDPAPADPGHNNVWDFFEFIRGWGARGYPIIGHFADICNSHGLYIKRGDANFDTKILLPDIVYLTAYIFNNGPAPLTVCNGDATNDGIINLPDVIHLVNYVFKAGPAPNPPLC